MVSTIASPAATKPMASGTVTIAGLDAQMQRYQRQLSDYVYGPTAKTPEGKAAIDKVNEKISIVKLQMEAVQAQRFEKSNATAERIETEGQKDSNDVVGTNIDTFA